MSENMNVNQALSEVQNMKRVFRAFEQAENAIAVLLNYDNTKQSLEQEVNRLQRLKDDLVPQVRQAQGDRDFAVAEGKRVLDDAKTRAGVIVQDARERAKAVEARASEHLAEAEEMKKAAADGLMAAEEALAAKRKELADLEVDLAAARATIKTAETIRGLIRSAEA